MDWMAVDILAGHTTELHSDSSSSRIAEPRQSCCQNGLLGSAGVGRSPYRSNHCPVPKKYLFGRVHCPVSHGSSWSLPRRHVDRRGKARDPATPSIGAVQIKGILVPLNVTQFLVGVALIIALVTVPLMAATVMEKKAWESALHLVRLTIAIPVGALVGGYILRWTGVRAVCITGLAFMGTGLLFMSGWDTEVQELRLTLPLIATGLGFGLVKPPIGVSALSAAPSHYWGAAASLVTASRMVGMALGLAALSAWGIERFPSLTAHATLGATYEETEAPLIEAGVTVFQNLFTIAGFLSLIAILPALLMRIEDAEETDSLA